MTTETNAERKVPLKDIKTGDSIYLYEWSGGEMRKEIEFRVEAIAEFSGGINLQLINGEGREKQYSFLDGDQLMNILPITDNPIKLDGETEVQKLRKENARLREALEFYAREGSVTDAGLLDDGKKARTVLNHRRTRNDPTHRKRDNYASKVR